MRLAAWLCAAVLLAAPSRAEEWLYPRCDLAHTGVTKCHGPKKKPSIRWSINELGAIMGQAALADDRVVYAVGERSFVCRSTEGKPIWEFKTKASALSAPLIRKSRIFFGCRDEVHYILMLADGREPASIGAYATNEVLASPAVTETHYLNGSLDGFFYAFDPASVRLRWKVETGPVTHGPVVARDMTFVVNTKGVLHGIRIRKGDVVWRCDVGAEPVAPPLIDGKRILLPTKDRIRIIDRKSGKPAGEYETPGICEAPCLARGILHYPTATGEIASLDLKSGRETGRIKVAEAALSSPLICASNVLYGTAQEVLFAVDPKRGSVLWTWEGDEVLTPPIVCDRQVFVGSGTTFYCLK